MAAIRLNEASEGVSDKLKEIQEFIGSTGVGLFVFVDRFGWARLKKGWGLAYIDDDGEKHSLLSQPLVVRCEALAHMDELMAALADRADELTEMILNALHMA